MSDLPEVKNEQTLGMPPGDLQEFSRGYLPAKDGRHPDDGEPPKSRLKHLPTLLAIFLTIVAAWHLFAASQLENQLTRNASKIAREDLPDISVNVDVQPLTNLVDLQITRNVAGNEGAFDTIGD